MKTVVALALMLISATAAAQINRCLDKGGKVVGYGGECPPGTRAEATSVKSGSAPAPAAAPAGASAAGSSAAPGAAKAPGVSAGAGGAAAAGAAAGTAGAASLGAGAGTAAPAAAGTAGAAPAAAVPKTTAEKDAEFRKRQMERQEAEAKDKKKAADAEARRRHCEDSQAYLKNLQSKQRITRTDPKSGDRSYLSDAEYPAEIARTQKVVAENCR